MAFDVEDYENKREVLAEMDRLDSAIRALKTRLDPATTDGAFVKLDRIDAADKTRLGATQEHMDYLVDRLAAYETIFTAIDGTGIF